MIVPDAALATRPEACSACGAALDALGRCGACGAVFGEAYRCPLCHALSGIESSTTLYYRCRACGGPRIPPTETPLSEEERELLRSARSAELRAVAFKAGAGFAAGSGALSVLITAIVLLVTSPGTFAKFAALLASVIPFALSAFAWRHAQRHATASAAALQQAWLLAAARVVAHHGGSLELGAAGLAKTLRIEESRAELLLAQLAVRDFVEQPAEVPARMRVTELADADELTRAAAEEAARLDASKP